MNTSAGKAYSSAPAIISCGPSKDVTPQPTKHFGALLASAAVLLSPQMALAEEPSLQEGDSIQLLQNVEETAASMDQAQTLVAPPTRDEDTAPKTEMPGVVLNESNAATPTSKTISAPPAAITLTAGVIALGAAASGRRQQLKDERKSQQLDAAGADPVATPTAFANADQSPSPPAEPKQSKQTERQLEDASNKWISEWEGTSAQDRADDAQRWIDNWRRKQELRTPEGRARVAQRWIDEWLITKSYDEFYKASGTVKIKRDVQNDTKTFDFGDYIELKKSGKISA